MVEIYVQDIQTGIVSVSEEPTLLRETVSTALVDGRNTLGPVVGNFCMDIAVRKARETGIGWVVARGTSYFLTTSPYRYLRVSARLENPQNMYRIWTAYHKT